ncbi:MAG: PilW family protein [Candidatus Xenobia bacterium]
MRAPRGFTLIEVMISTALAALVMGVILGFLLKGMQSFSLSQEQAEIHEATLIGMHEVTGLMQASDVHSVSINPTNPDSFPAVAFVSGFDDNGTLQFDYTNTSGSNLPANAAAQAGNSTSLGPNNNGTTNDQTDTTAFAFNRDGYIQWQRYVVFYYDTKRRALCEQEIKFTPTISPNPLQLASFTASPRDRAVALNIDSFSVTWAGAAQTNPVNVTISARKVEDVPHGTYQPHISTLQSSVVLENGFYTSGAFNFNFFLTNRTLIQQSSLMVKP